MQALENLREYLMLRVNNIKKMICVTEIIPRHLEHKVCINAGNIKVIWHCAAA